MATVRVQLPDGQWADLEPRLTHARSKRLRKALLAIDGNEGLIESTTEFVLVYLVAWSVRGLDGTELTADEAGVLAAPEDVIDAMLPRVTDLIRERRLTAEGEDPNADGPRSDDSRPASQ